MKLSLRNWLAERCLRAISDAEDAGLHALDEFASRADLSGELAKPSAEAVASLLTAGSPFEPAGTGLRLRREHEEDLPALRRRAARYASALRALRAGTVLPEPDDDLDRALGAAAALFNAGLFFETHEILEPPWRVAEEPLRTFLQGLIQVAAGLHHRENGNLRGAESLLREGLVRLHPFSPAAYGVDIREFLRGVEAAAEGLIDPARRAEAPVLVVGREG